MKRAWFAPLRLYDKSANRWRWFGDLCYRICFGQWRLHWDELVVALCDTMLAVISWGKLFVSLLFTAVFIIGLPIFAPLYAFRCHNRAQKRGRK